MLFQLEPITWFLIACAPLYGEADEITKLTKLGAGAGGVVYKAIHKPTNTLCALKQINAMARGRGASVKTIAPVCQHRFFNIILMFVLVI